MGMRHLVIGMGSMGQKNLSILRQLRRNDEFITVDANGTAGYDRIHPELVNGSVVYICTPTNRHWADIELSFWNKPMAIFVEKPLFSSRSGFHPSLFSLKNTDYQHLPFCVGYQYRFHPVFQSIKRDQSTDRHITHFHIYASDRSVARYPDPPLETLLSHPIATAQWLFGDMVKDGNSPKTYNDSALGMAAFYAKSQSGVEITMSANTFSEKRISLCVTNWEDDIYRFASQEITNVYSTGEMYLNQMQAWLNYVETGELGELCGWDEALKVQELLW